MNMTDRDRRALRLLGVAVILALVFYGITWFLDRPQDTVSMQASVPRAQLDLQRVRRLVGGLPAREETHKKVAGALALREKGIIRAETAPQAQAQLVQIVRRLLNAQQPPIAFRTTELAAPKRLTPDYGEVTAKISMDCGIEQVVNLLADLGNQPELITIRELTFGQANPKQKTVPVTVTVGAIVDPKLVPEEKEGRAF